MAWGNIAIHKQIREFLKSGVWYSKRSINNPFGLLCGSAVGERIMQGKPIKGDWQWETAKGMFVFNGQEWVTINASP